MVASALEPLIHNLAQLTREACFSMYESPYSVYLITSFKGLLRHTRREAGSTRPSKFADAIVPHKQRRWTSSRSKYVPSEKQDPTPMTPCSTFLCVYETEGGNPRHLQDMSAFPRCTSASVLFPSSSDAGDRPFEVVSSAFG